MSTKNWWNSVKDYPIWSGAIVGLDWDELWPDAQGMLVEVWRYSSPQSNNPENRRDVVGGGEL